ncbi:Polysaccharide biosynthesis protein [Thermoplasmatales archaeon]|nr:Polysaccharide biosynthesis protein [Thermoplasmatales archaeon]
MFSRKSSIIVSQNVISAIFGYIGLFFITRFIGVQDFGFLAFGMGFAGTMSLVTDLGFTTANVKTQAEGKDIAENNGTFLAIKLALGLIFVIVTLSALFIWTDVLHRGFESPVEYWVIIALIPYYFFSSLVGFTNSFYSANLSPTRLAMPPLIEAILRNSIFIFLGLAFFYNLPGHDIISGAIALGITYSITYTAYFLISLYIGRPWKIGRPSWNAFRKYRTIALPLAFSAALGTVNGNIDKVIIQFFWQATATAAFYADQKIVLLISSLSSAVSVFFLPMLSRIHTHGTRESFASSVKEYERFISIFILPFVVLFIVYSSEIVNLFSAAFIGYSAILGILAINIYFSITLSPYSSALIARGKSPIIGILSLLSVSANIVLNFILVPPIIFGTRIFSLGVDGAAISTLLVTLANYVILQTMLYRSHGAGFNFYLARQLFPAGAEAAFLVGISLMINVKDILVLLPVSVASILIFVGIALIIKEVSLEEIKIFIRGLNPIGFKKSLEEEMSGKK